MTSDPEGPEAFDDGAWLQLTENLEPYERFRYIVRHVLDTALDDARAYVEDERLFADLEGADEASLEEHLDELDRRLQADGELSDLEARFMCAAVDAALRELGLRSRCYGELADLAEPARPPETD